MRLKLGAPKPTRSAATDKAEEKASALVWRLEVPAATITRSNSGESFSVLKTWMSCARAILIPFLFH